MKTNKETKDYLRRAEKSAFNLLENVKTCKQLYKIMVRNNLYCEVIPYEGFIALEPKTKQELIDSRKMVFLLKGVKFKAKIYSIDSPGSDYYLIRYKDESMPNIKIWYYQTDFDNVPLPSKDGCRFITKTEERKVYVCERGAI
jgi:hypothetical protein